MLEAQGKRGSSLLLEHFFAPHSKPGELPGPQCGPNLLLWGAAWSGPWGEGGRDSGGSVMMESGKGSPDPQAGVTGLQRGWERRHHEFIGSWDQWNTKPARPQPRRGHRGCPHGPAQGQGPISLPTVIRSWKDSAATHPSKRGASKRGAENGDGVGAWKIEQHGDRHRPKESLVIIASKYKLIRLNLASLHQRPVGRGLSRTTIDIKLHSWAPWAHQKSCSSLQSCPGTA